MCGIVGAIGDPIHENALKTFHTAFYLNELRGGDGCGIMSMSAVGGAGIKRIGMPDVYKDHEATSDYLQTGKDYEEITKFSSGKRVIIGHARAATKGILNNDNTQPIIAEHIFGVMNGTLKGERWNKNEEVSDSNLLFDAIREEGPLPVLEAIKDEPYALVWVDALEDKVFMIRSKDRPMAILKTTGDSLLFSSDYNFLDFSARFHKATIEKNGLFTVEPNVLIVWDLKANFVSRPEFVGDPKEYFGKKQVG